MKTNVTIGALTTPHSLENMPSSAVPGVPDIWLGLSLVHARSFGSESINPRTISWNAGMHFPHTLSVLAFHTTGDSPQTPDSHDAGRQRNRRC